MALKIIIYGGCERHPIFFPYPGVGFGGRSSGISQDREHRAQHLPGGARNFELRLRVLHRPGCPRLETRPVFRD